MKSSPIMPSPVTVALSRPTDTDGSSTEATAQDQVRPETLHAYPHGQRARVTSMGVLGQVSRISEMAFCSAGSTARLHLVLMATQSVA